MVDDFMEESLVTKYFFIHCHLQSAISCWYLLFPSISRLQDTQVWTNLT